MKVITILLLAVISTISSQAFFDVDDFPKDNYWYGAKDKGFIYSTHDLKRERKVVLTFDDGPNIETTPRLLDILKKYKVKATFFISTKKNDPASLAIIDRTLREGHFIASHDHTHEDNNKTSEPAFRADLMKSLLIIEDSKQRTGVKQKEVYFRFPFGAYGLTKKYHHMNVIKDVSYELYDENCINFVFWDIDTNDWVPNMTPQKIVDNVISSVIGGTIWERVGKKSGEKIIYSIAPKYVLGLGGGIVLMHDILPKSVDAVEQIILRLKKNNIKIVPLNQSENFNFDKKNCELKG